eukprot:CAMPEP_0185692248 /NCGR_PEP_ID=MMETSP1164-20130828/2407_1 /TAXON_ID=1104430 /ORGANISM="Chrysoreinhardia sp, Strain CCMP2950" /LENGTH=183 /DNA_ID=CAMNT_0028358967 /DNA_START=44 /DNA_END=593 /DNA_ORIENTATION=-
MAAALEIAPSTEDERGAILALYPLAFPTEDVTGLVSQLLAHPDAVSLTARRDGTVVGHAVFTRCRVTGSAARVALLGPLCVAPSAQRSGVGTALIEAGAAELGATGTTALLTLGDPGYYGPRGFDAPSPIAAPYALKPEWRDAWRVRRLGESDGVPPGGTLEVPAPWAAPASGRDPHGSPDEE